MGAQQPVCVCVRVCVCVCVCVCISVCVCLCVYALLQVECGSSHPSWALPPSLSQIAYRNQTGYNPEKLQLNLLADAENDQNQLSHFFKVLYVSQFSHKRMFHFHTASVVKLQLIHLVMQKKTNI